MACYLIATVRITDAARFGEYAKAVAGLSERFGGESVVKGPVADVLEGSSAPGERVVVTRFASSLQARGYISSPEYQAARKLREGAGQVLMRLVEA